MDQDRIPKIIHSVWIGNGEKSEIAKKSMVSWQVFCPDYAFMEWNESNFDIKNSCRYVVEAYSKGKWAFVSDYIRLKILYEYGGIYLDTDMELLQNIDSFLKYRGFFCTESRYSVSTAIIAAEPQAPWIKELLDEYENEPFINEDGSFNKQTNTKRVQKYLEIKYNYSWEKGLQELLPGFYVFPADFFSPLNCYTGVLNMTNNTFAIHHYDNTWMSPEEKIKKRLKQIATRIIGEDNRAKMVQIKEKLSKKSGGGYRYSLILTTLCQPLPSAKIFQWEGAPVRRLKYRQVKVLSR